MAAEHALVSMRAEEVAIVRQEVEVTATAEVLGVKAAGTAAGVLALSA